MKIFLVLLLASTSAPALAQHTGHTMPAPAPETEQEKAKREAAASDPHAGHRMPTPPAATPASPPAAMPGHDMSTMQPAAPAKPASPMPGHDMSTMQPAAPAKPASPMPGHDMSTMQPTAPAKPAAPMPGHDMGTMQPAVPAMPADPMPGHDMSSMDAAPPAPAVAPPPPPALAGPPHAADAVYGAEEMAEARARETAEHGGTRTYKVMIDQLEMQARKGDDGYYWEALAWYGGDINKLWISTEGEGNFGEGPEKSEIQVLYSRALNPWFNLQTGARHDFRPDPQRSHLVLGIEGLAPYWFEINAAIFLSTKGEFTARFEGEYDQRLTRRLILQPRLEFNLAAQNAPGIRVGSGLVNVETGLRLRYEFKPEFAPYIGVGYQRAFGNTADFARARGDNVGGLSLLLGVRTWF